MMIESHLLQEDNLKEIILKIVADYQTITTMDIWFEIGEDERFKGDITLTGVKQTLSQLEKERMVLKRGDDQWGINKANETGLVKGREINHGRIKSR